MAAVSVKRSIIPLALMASVSIAHLDFGLMAIDSEPILASHVFHLSPQSRAQPKTTFLSNA